MTTILFSVVIAASLVAFFFFFTSKLRHKKSSKLPPGSFGWPLIGETLEYLQMTRKGMQETFIRSRMENYDSRVFRTSMLGESLAFFCGPAGNKLLFSNENKLVAVWWPSPVRRLFKSCLITKVGDEAKRMRRMLMTFLDPEALQRYIATIDTITQQHFKTNWESKEEVKVYPLVKMYTFELACRLFLSVDEPEKIMKLFHQFNTFNKGVESIPLNFPGTRFYRAARAANAIRGELQEIIKHRRVALEEKTASPSQDLLSHLLVHADETGWFMPETEIKNNILVLIFAGHDTSSSVLTLLMKYLGELPDVYDKVLKEQMEITMAKGPRELLNWGDIQKMRYSWNVVSEVMRIFPAVTGSYREAIIDFNYGAYTIPKGWKLSWNTNSTHQDPTIFPNPNQFDASRFEGEGPLPFTYVPFGGGPRMCLGKEYARLEILVFLHNVVKRFKWKLLFHDEKIKVDPMPIPTKGLPIHLRPHQS